MARVTSTHKYLNEWRETDSHLHTHLQSRFQWFFILFWLQTATRRHRRALMPFLRKPSRIVVGRRCCVVVSILMLVGVFLLSGLMHSQRQARERPAAVARHPAQATPPIECFGQVVRQFRFITSPIPDHAPAPPRPPPCRVRASWLCRVDGAALDPRRGWLLPPESWAPRGAAELRALRRHALSRCGGRTICTHALVRRSSL